MNYCFNCGTKVVDRGRYCVECGRSVLDEPRLATSHEYAKIGGILLIVGGLIGIFSSWLIFRYNSFSPTIIFFVSIRCIPYVASVLAGYLALQRRNWPMCLVLAIVGGVGLTFDINIISMMGAVFIWIAKKEFTDVDWVPRASHASWFAEDDDDEDEDNDKADRTGEGIGSKDKGRVSGKSRVKFKAERPETKVMYRCSVCNEFLDPQPDDGWKLINPTCEACRKKKRAGNILKVPKGDTHRENNG